MPDVTDLPGSSTDERPARATGRGFGRVLVVVYAVFALAATARSFVQIATRFDEAPVAYTLSALAAVIYIVATVALARGDRTSRRVATVAITVELVGVLLQVGDELGAVRQDQTYRAVPILVLTTESDEEKKMRARRAGATGWIVKPFDPAKLIAAVRRVAA